MDDCDFTINVHESDDDVFNKPNSLVKKSQKSIESKKKTFLSKSPQKKKSTFEEKNVKKVTKNKEGNVVREGDGLIIVKQSNEIGQSMEFEDNGENNDEDSEEDYERDYKKEVHDDTNDDEKEKKLFKKGYVLNLEEDPHLYHAKPSALDAITGTSSSSNTKSAPTDKNKLSKSIFTPTKFSDFSGLNSKLCNVLELPKKEGGLGLEQSTKVQSSVLPLFLKQKNNNNQDDTEKNHQIESVEHEELKKKKKDQKNCNPNSVLMKSQTGSGKTLAFLLPILNDLMSIDPTINREEGTHALILSPTRELCNQICQVAEKVVNKACNHLVCGSVTGGERKKSEKARLRKGIVILVATPGRLLDHLKTTESFTLKQLRWVVLDEADRLLDMGFERTILEILSILRGNDNSSLNIINTNNGSNEMKGKTLMQRSSEYRSTTAKTTTKKKDVCYVMASATLSRAVRRLTGPVMGEKEKFYLVDAEVELVRYLDWNTCDKMRDEDSNSSIVLGNTSTSSRNKNRNNNKSSDSNNDSNSNSNSSDNTSGLSMIGGTSLGAPAALHQYTMIVSAKWRLSALIAFLRLHKHEKIMVFMSTCDSVDFHSLLLRDATWPIELDPNPREVREKEKQQAYENKMNRDQDQEEAMLLAQQQEQFLKRDNNNNNAYSNSNHKKFHRNQNESLEPLEASFTGLYGPNCMLFRLHGNVPQATRLKVYREFSEAGSGVLLCTDVAARGLDLPKVDWIVQFDPPCDTSDYVHRAGRTARSGGSGSTILFLLPSEVQYGLVLQHHGLNTVSQSLDNILQQVSSHIDGSSSFKNQAEMAGVILQRRMETVVMNNRTLTACAKQAFRAYIRAYATHSADTKAIFKIHSLHLGHVAKMFALLDNPKQVRVSEDVISKVINGDYSITKAAERAEARRQARQEKYALSGKGRNNDRNDRGGGNPNRGGKRKANDYDNCQDHDGINSRYKKEKQWKPAVKVRSIAGKGRGSNKSGAALTASGRFRRSDGYFRKKLKHQANSEFAA